VRASVAITGIALGRLTLATVNTQAGQVKMIDAGKKLGRPGIGAGTSW
jgi:hypothetical protein